LQKRSHKLLASALLNSHDGFQARRFELAFLFGSFQPDCNPFSYLKGSRHGKALGGHNYINSRSYIAAHIEKLQQRKSWSIWHYYTLGKLTHYLADAFTYPHNEHFPDSMMDHHRYETTLRHHFSAYLAQQKLRRETLSRSLTETLTELHRQYMGAGSSPQRDIEYILQATSLLMAGCLPSARFVGDCT